MSGASHLAAIYGSEQDKVNCSFYLKIGACRHGDRCSRKHVRPTFSQTLVVQNMYQNPAHLHHNPAEPGPTAEEQERMFNEFYEDVFCELVKYGNLLEMHVCDNVNDHLIGNVYARYDWEDEAAAAVTGLNQRWYAGRPLFAELSPVTDFREACCRQNDSGECERGGFCNFVHLKEPDPRLVHELHAQQRLERRVNPSQKDIERQKEMEMFNGNGPNQEAEEEEEEGYDDDRDRRRRRRDREVEDDSRRHRDEYDEQDRRRKDRDRRRERDRERDRDRERERDRGDRDRDRDRDREREREKGDRERRPRDDEDNNDEDHDRSSNTRGRDRQRDRSESKQQEQEKDSETQNQGDGGVPMVTD